MKSKIGKIMFEQELKDLMKESHIKEKALLNEIRKNNCVLCGDDCIFKEFFQDDYFIKEIMPRNGETDRLKCILIKEILLEA